MGGGRGWRAVQVAPTGGIDMVPLPMQCVLHASRWYCVCAASVRAPGGTYCTPATQSQPPVSPGRHSARLPHAPAAAARKRRAAPGPAPHPPAACGLLSQWHRPEPHGGSEGRCSSASRPRLRRAAVYCRPARRVPRQRRLPAAGRRRRPGPLPGAGGRPLLRRLWQWRRSEVSSRAPALPHPPAES